MSNPMSHEFQLVDISVDGQQWTQVQELSSLGPDDQCYVYELDYAHGRLKFGDGIHGKRPPFGSRVVATYGGGSLGNVVIQLDKYAFPLTTDIELWMSIQSIDNSLSIGNFGKIPIATPEQPLTGRRCVFLCSVLLVTLIVALLVTQVIRL